MLFIIIFLLHFIVLFSFICLCYYIMKTVDKKTVRSITTAGDDSVLQQKTQQTCLYIPRVSPSRESKLSSPKLLRRRGCWCVCGGRPLTTPFRSSDTPPGMAPIEPSPPSNPSSTGDCSPRCAIGGPLKNEGGNEEGWGCMGVCIRRGGLESPYCCGNWLFPW